jgi:Leucine-rich repeat (LRR) protein
MNINGTIPSELSALKSLQKISMVGDMLQGTLPPSLGNLSLLGYFDVSGNFLSGSIPESYSQWRKLRYFRAHWNALTGTINPNFFQILRLEDIGLEQNMLTGRIPECLVDASITKMDMGLNQFSGTVPESIFVHANKLEFVSLWSNQLTGTLSNNVAALSNLVFLDMETNHMTGTLPVNLTELENLQELYLSDNELSGTLPKEFEQFRRMKHLWIHNNHLTGQIPTELVALMPAQTLIFHGNNMTGTLDFICNETPLFITMTADCGGDDPLVDCPCCTRCCDHQNPGNCTTNFNSICAVYENQYVSPGGKYYEEGRGTVCECVMEEGSSNSLTLVCHDTACTPCNRDGTVCVSSQEFGADYQEDSHFWTSWQATYQYSGLRNDTVTFRERILDNYRTECEVAVNGAICDSCNSFECADSFSGFHVNCENVPGAGNVDLCDDNPDDHGPLTVFALQDPLLVSGCTPRLSFEK